jgi:hypothetical protein
MKLRRLFIALFWASYYVFFVVGGGNGEREEANITRMQ